MPKVRKEIPELEKLVQVGRKKFVRYEEGAQLYSMGLHTFQELAKDAKEQGISGRTMRDVRSRMKNELEYQINEKQENSIRLKE